MIQSTRLSNVATLSELLPLAEAEGYAVGSFSPRLTPLIAPVLRAAERLASPVIIQISQKEFLRAGIMPDEFAREFYQALYVERITVPVALHLDHTRGMRLIQDAIAAGFTSAMIDASECPLAENIKATREVVEYAHARGVSVEGELGRIGTTDFVETDADEQGLTDPDEARRMADETGVDALAVSVGTAHGLYRRAPHLDFARITAIRRSTTVSLVLHGGSDVPAELIRKAITLPGGGVSKINIATDLEVAMLRALGREQRLTEEQFRALPTQQIDRAIAAVEETVCIKIMRFLGSARQTATCG